MQKYSIYSNDSCEAIVCCVLEISMRQFEIGNVNGR